MSGVLAGKRVVVTGSTRGLGRAFALACARHGADVVVNGRDVDALAAVQAEIAALGVRCKAVAGSVAETAVADALVDCAQQAFGGLDCLVNNAGITRDRTLTKMSDDEFDDVIAVNLRGAWACGRAAARAMRETGGSIVNVVSNTGETGAIGQTNYGAAKAGLAGMTRSWTRELARNGIRVNSIWPIAETEMTAGIVEHMRTAATGADGVAPDARALGFGAPNAVADIVVFLAADASAEVNGQMITFNGERLALWSHPRETVLVHRDAWTPAAIAAEFAGPLGRRLEPLYDAF